MAVLRLLSLLLVIALFSVQMGFANAQTEDDPEPKAAEAIKERLRTFGVEGGLVRAPSTNKVLARSESNMAILESGQHSYRMAINSTPLEDRNSRLPPSDLVSFSYASDVTENLKERPVLFAFNGGPGSSSMWLHMGAWGPKRIATPGTPDRFSLPPYPLEENRAFLIDVADLVFVDPIGTGLSRARDPEQAQAFFSVTGDAGSLCSYVTQWLRAEGRWGAPVYLAGESYGSLRIAAMAVHPGCRQLRRHLKGLIFVSGLLDLTQNRRYSLTVSLPTRAALAWYHGFVDRSLWDNDLEAFLDEAIDVAVNDVSSALLKGHSISSADEAALMSKIARLTGLSETNRPESLEELKAAFARQARQAGFRGYDIYDARFTNQRIEGSKRPVSLNFSNFVDVFSTHLGEMVLDLTGFDLSGEYVAMNLGSALRRWRYNSSSGTQGGGVNLARELARKSRLQANVRAWKQGEREKSADDNKQVEITVNAPVSGPRLMVVSGLHDLVTPFFGMELALQSAGFSPDAYEIHLYEGGHMMYFDKEIGEQLANDVRAFIASGEES